MSFNSCMPILSACYYWLFFSHQGVTVSYHVKVGKNNQIPLPDDLCKELRINLGDILICKLVENSTKIEMTKHENQTLSDAEIASVENLKRVIPCILD